MCVCAAISWGLCAAVCAQALKGHGGVARLVLLPHESHGYRAYESVMHTLYEQDQWLERYDSRCMLCINAGDLADHADRYHSEHAAFGDIVSGPCGCS